MKKKILLSIVFIISLVFILIGIVEANETNEVKLNNIILKSETTIGLGENLKFEVDTSGEITYISCTFRNKKTGEIITGYLINSFTEIDVTRMSGKLVEGEYYLSDVNLFTNKSGPSIHYSNFSKGNNVYYLESKVDFKVENPIKLNNIILKSETTIGLGENLKFEVDTSGEITYISCTFRNKKTGEIITGYLNNSFTEIDVTKMSGKLVEGEYYLSDVNLSTNKSGQSIHYSNFSKGNNVRNLETKIEFLVKNNQIVEENVDLIEEENEIDIPKMKLNKIKLKSDKVETGKKIYFNLEIEGDIKRIFLSFANDKNEVIDFSIYDLTTNEPYIIIPENIELGKYELRYIVLRDYEEHEVHYEYEVIEKNNFTIELEIEKNSENIDVTSKENEPKLNKLELYDEKTLKQDEIKINKNILIKVGIIIVCIVVLLLIFTKKILTNKKKENKEE